MSLADYAAYAHWANQQSSIGQGPPGTWQVAQGPSSQPVVEVTAFPPPPMPPAPNMRFYPSLIGRPGHHEPDIGLHHRYPPMPANPAEPPLPTAPYGMQVAPEQQHRRRDRSRGRRHRRAHLTPAAPDPRQVLSTSGRDGLRKAALEFVSALEPDEFFALFNDLPRHLRAAAWRPPPNIVVDIQSLDEKDKNPMRARINAIRRERCVQLCDPKQAAYWEEESWTITPMFRQGCRHFWELFRDTITSESKWKATMDVIRNCPEKLNKNGDTPTY